VTAGRGWWGALRLVLGLALLGVVVARTGAMRLMPQLRAAPWLALLFIVQAFLGMVVEAQRLRLLLRSQAVPLSFGLALRFCVTAVPFSYVVPGGVGGDVMKLVSLSGEKASHQVELASVILVDRMIGLVSLLLVALGAAFGSSSFAGAPAPLHAAALAAGLGLAAAALGVALAWSPAVRGSPMGRWSSETSGLRRAVGRALDALVAFRAHQGAALAALGLTLVGHVLLAGFFIIAGRVVLPTVPADTVAWASLLALVANVLPLTPGGLGVGEAAFAAAFRMLGYAGGAQLLLLVRIGALPLAMAGGLLYILGGRRCERRSSADGGSSRG